MSRYKADLALALVTLIWGTSFVLVKWALESATPLLFISMRFALASLCLLLIFPRALKRIKLQTIGQGAIAGLFLFAGFFFQTVGLKFTTPSKSAFITGLSVVLVPILSALIFGVAPSRNAAAGVVIATIGLALLTRPASGELSLNRGDVLTFLCAVAFALHILSIERYLRRSHYLQLLLVQILATAILSTLFAFSWENHHVVLNEGLFIPLILTGVFATALAFSIQNWAQQHTTATHTALIFSLEPIFAAIFSYLFFGERLTASELAGGILIVAGIVLAEIKR